jgi:hypothetical protein
MVLPASRAAKVSHALVPNALTSPNPVMVIEGDGRSVASDTAEL